MPITDFLERNARIYPNDVALVEVNPANQPATNLTWREYDLIETAASKERYRREITWKQFDVAANRFANLLFTRGIRRGDKVAILLMNCIELAADLFRHFEDGRAGGADEFPLHR